MIYPKKIIEICNLLAVQEDLRKCADLSQLEHFQAVTLSSIHSKQSFISPILEGDPVLVDMLESIKWIVFEQSDIFQMLMDLSRKLDNSGIIIGINKIVDSLAHALGRVEVPQSFVVISDLCVHYGLGNGMGLEVSRAS